MNKINIIILRELTTRVKKKSFIVMTILMPFLMVLLVMAPVLLGQITGDNQERIAVIDQTGKYADCLKSNKEYVFVRYDKMEASLKSDAKMMTENSEMVTAIDVICALVALSSGGQSHA